MKKIETIHDEQCPCKAYVIAKFESDGYHRVALRLQNAERHSQHRAAKDNAKN